LECVRDHGRNVDSNVFQGLEDSKTAAFFVHRRISLLSSYDFIRGLWWKLSGQSVLLYNLLADFFSTNKDIWRRLNPQTNLLSPDTHYKNPYMISYGNAFPNFSGQDNIGGLLGKIARGKLNPYKNCPPDVREITQAPRGSPISKRY